MFPPEPRAGEPPMPPISNKALYAYRVAAKWFSFFFFGVSTLILITLIFPVMRLALHPKERFRKYGRRFVSASMRFFVGVMHTLGIVNLEADRKYFRHLSGKIITANHPSLLDVIMLFSLVPNADCIVNSYLTHTIVAGVIRQLYIYNYLDSDALIRACTESLRQGNCLIIFPEGTRTPRAGRAILKKGAARIAMASGRNIIPLHIGGTDKYGLGKKDPWTAFNPRERYVYKIDAGTEINPEKYRSLPAPAAAKAITQDMATFLFPVRQETAAENFPTEESGE